jgi:signal recognition particle receptor subunit beta
MNTSDELKIVFAGPMGAGKTTAIRAISDTPPVATEVRNTDRRVCDKDATTVALDFGQLRLEDGTAVKLYGTPGQARFSFMWEILCRGSLGVILLIDGSTPTAGSDLQEYACAFRRMNPAGPFVIGIGRLPVSDEEHLDRYAAMLAESGIVAPVYGVDVRKREDVLLLVETLLCILETQVMEATDDVA